MSFSTSLLSSSIYPLLIRSSLFFAGVCSSFPPSSSSSPSLSLVGRRSLATASEPDAPPVRHYGGLKDQDRIFTNVYNKHDWGIKGAMVSLRRSAERDQTRRIENGEGHPSLGRLVYISHREGFQKKPPLSRRRNKRARSRADLGALPFEQGSRRLAQDEGDSSQRRYLAHRHHQEVWTQRKRRSWFPFRSQVVLHEQTKLAGRQEVRCDEEEEDRRGRAGIDGS